LIEAKYKRGRLHLQLKKIFGHMVYKLRLEAGPDEGSETLFIGVIINGAPQAVLGLKEKFINNWVIPFHRNLTGRLNLEIE
jgi:hypothetical protein